MNKNQNGGTLFRRPGKSVATLPKVIGFYTVGFIACSFVILAIFHLNGKTIFWINDSGDGLYQHYNAFNHVCSLLSSLLHGEQIALFDFTLGQGMDIFGALAPYDLADPVSWVCACLFPFSRTTRYLIMVFSKLWLCGFSFAVLCWEMQKRDNLAAVACGALCYVFSGAMLWMFAKHPNFASWGYCLPLVLAGIERARRNGAFGLFGFAVGLNALVNFYTLYIDFALAVTYALVRALIACRAHETTVRSEVMLLVKMAITCLLAFLSVSVVLLPTLYAYSTNTRVAETNGYSGSLLVYSADWYRRALASIILGRSLFGISVFALVPTVLLFACGKRLDSDERAVRAFIVIVIVMLCSPAIGLVLNGFEYPTTRFGFVLSLFCSLAIVIAFPLADRRGLKPASFGACLAMILGAFLVFTATPSYVTAFIGLAVLAGSAAIATCASTLVSGRKRSAAYATIALVCALGQSFILFVPQFENFVSEFADSENFKSGYLASSSDVIEPDEAFRRVETQERQGNKEGLRGARGTSAWWSLMPQSMADYHSDLGLSSMVQNCNVQGLDARPGLMALASVAWYTTPKDARASIPDDWQQSNASSKLFEAYRNPLSLPIGYAYESCIGEANYAQLSPIAKELALLQGAVVDDPESACVSETNPTTPVQAVEATVKKETGASVIVPTASDESASESSGTDGACGYDVAKAKGKVTYSVKAPAGSYLFMTLKNASCTVSDMSVTATHLKAGNTVVASSSGHINSDEYNWPVAYDEMVFFLGKCDKKTQRVELSFSRRCRIDFDEIQFYSVAEEQYRDGIERLSKHTLQDVRVEADRITGAISLDQPMVLQLSIPYSRGWNAYVDDQPRELFRSGGMYCGMNLEPGDHDIVLEYRTPYLVEGIVLSLVTLAAITALLVIRRRSKKAESKRTLVVNAYAGAYARRTDPQD